MIEVTPSQAKQLDLLRTKYDIKLIVGFGSKVRGNVHQSSDLDVGVLFNRGTLTMKCLQDLEAVFPLEEVDPACLNRADPLFLGQITAQCALLSGTESDFHEFRCYAFQRYADFLPYLALEATTNSRRLETY
ncbi:MAG: type VII toxin-antitoxin system MntA family adenylyltransferase antitoxin [Spirochaetia bacterium]